MIPKTLASVCLLFALPTVAVAQRPPLLTEPRAWVVHNERGPMPYEIEITFGYPDLLLGCWVYWNRCKDTNTQEVVSEGVTYAPMDGNGATLHSWSSDSQLWSRWVWNRDHYDKVGGSEHVRSYWPAR